MYMRRQRYKHKEQDYQDSFSMAVLASNMSSQFTSPKISPLNSEDAMLRYQTEMLKTYIPEIRPPADEDKLQMSRNRFRLLHNSANNGGPKGDNTPAYKPEITQTNVSTYFYPSNNGSGPNYMVLPNHTPKGEIARNIWNTRQRINKQRKVPQIVENTRREQDILVNRYDSAGKYRATRYGNLRSAKSFEVPIEGTNRNKTKCVTRDAEVLYQRDKIRNGDHIEIVSSDIMANMVSKIGAPIKSAALPNTAALILDLSDSKVAKNKRREAINKVGQQKQFHDNAFPSHTYEEAKNNSAINGAGLIKSVPLGKNAKLTAVQANFITAERINEIKAKTNIKHGHLKSELDVKRGSNINEDTNSAKKLVADIKSAPMRVAVEATDAVNERLFSNKQRVVLPEHVMIGAEPDVSSFPHSNETESVAERKGAAISSGTLRNTVATMMNDIVEGDGANKKKNIIERHNVYGGNNLGYRGDFGKAMQELPDDINNNEQDVEYDFRSGKISTGEKADFVRASVVSGPAIHFEAKRIVEQGNFKEQPNNVYFGDLREHHRAERDIVIDDGQLLSGGLDDQCGNCG
jgi:hypothetical protein